MEQKTSINPACLQQMFDSAANAKEKGQSQFFTPPEFGRLLADLLPNHRRTVVDLSCGKGHLLHACATPESVDLLGCDIDPVALKFLNLPKHSSQLSQSKITGDLTKLFPLLVDVRFQADCFVLNPPFGLHWYRRQLTTLSQSECPAVARSFSVRDGQCPAECIDSTIATLMIALDRCTVRGEGFLIANEATLQRLLFAPLAPYQELARHIWAHLTFTGNVMTGSTHGQWDNEFNTGVIYFARAHQDGPQYTRHFDSLPPELPGGLREHRHDADIYLPYHQHSDTGLEWAAARDEWERLNGRAEYPFNIWLDSAHHIHTHLSLYDDRNPRIPKGVAERLHSLNGKSPMQLVLQRATRKTLEEAVYGGIWRVEPALQTAVSQAVHEYHAQRAPLYPLPEVQRLGYLDELDFITCRRTLKRKSVWFQAGKDYPVETKTGTVTRKTMRPNLKGEMELVEYTGSELFFLLTDEQGVKQVFVEQRLINEDTDLSKAGLPDCEPISLEKLVEHFVIPEVADVATVNPAGYAASLAQLDQIATFCGITPRRFQREDISRATLHDGLIVAWDTGLGKTGHVPLVPAEGRLEHSRWPDCAASDRSAGGTGRPSRTHHRGSCQVFPGRCHRTGFTGHLSTLGHRHPPRGRHAPLKCLDLAPGVLHHQLYPTGRQRREADSGRPQAQCAGMAASAGPHRGGGRRLFQRWPDRFGFRRLLPDLGSCPQCHYR